MVRFSTIVRSSFLADSVTGNIIPAAVGLVEASGPKAYPRVPLTGATTLSGSAVRTLDDGEGASKTFCLAASSFGHLPSQCSIVCGSSLQRGHSGFKGGVEEIGVGFQQRSVTSSKARKEDCVRSVANGHPTFGPGGPAIKRRKSRLFHLWYQL